MEMLRRNRPVVKSVESVLNDNNSIMDDWWSSRCSVYTHESTCTSAKIAI